MRLCEVLQSLNPRARQIARARGLEPFLYGGGEIYDDSVRSLGSAGRRCDSTMVEWRGGNRWQASSMVFELNTAGMTFLDLDWPTAYTLMCAQCSRTEWFGQAPERL